MLHRAMVAVALGILTQQARAQVVTQRARPAAPSDSVRVDSGFRSVVLRRRALEGSLEASQLTFVGGDLGLSGRTRFEGIIAPHLLLTTGRWAVAATPKIVLRMLADSSASVRSPSFMPRATVYYFLDDPATQNRDVLTVLSFLISHHSNGQSGPFYLDTARTRINLETGSFSTNFLEIAHQTFIRDNGGVRAAGIRLGFRAHVPINENDELRDYKHGTHQYGRYRVLASSQGVYRWARVSWGAQYMIDRKVGTSRFYSGRRFIGTLTVAWMPEALRDVGLFAQYYRGQDYYNILYAERVQALRLGFSVNATSNVRVP